jgi:hypothetical protein
LGAICNDSNTLTSMWFLSKKISILTLPPYMYK